MVRMTGSAILLQCEGSQPQARPSWGEPDSVKSLECGAKRVVCSNNLRTGTQWFAAAHLE